MNKRGNVDKRGFWRRQVELSGRHPGSVSDFCRRHGLSRGRLQYWKKRLAQERLPALRNHQASLTPAFAEVVVEGPRRGVELPDPRWLAELISHLGRGVDR